MKSTTRRNFLRAMLIGAVCSPTVFDLFAEETASSPEKKAESFFSAKVLKLDLYAKTKAEEAYIDYVVKMLDSKKISFKIVYASYKYAMKKKKGQRMFYFARVLPILSKQSGYKLSFPSLEEKEP
ncbi:MAG: hypothetical protein Q4G69_09045 [Planctomycetia bacterium]|nr:hypothetical protein [Planctomycetia bacterium]